MILLTKKSGASGFLSSHHPRDFGARVYAKYYPEGNFKKSERGLEQSKFPIP